MGPIRSGGWSNPTQALFNQLLLFIAFIDLFETSWLFLSRLFTHFNFRKNKFRSPLDRFFGCRNAFRAGGGRIRPTFWWTPEWSFFIAQRAFLCLNHLKFNFQSPKTVYFSKMSIFVPLLIDLKTKIFFGSDS